VRTPSAEEFRKTIEELLGNRDLVVKIGERARNIVNQVPSLSDHANNILNLYTKAIGERSP
jgi:DNA-directed RNA polymerase subunit K/omega